jgi:hypothetical protein
MLILTLLGGCAHAERHADHAAEDGTGGGEVTEGAAASSRPGAGGLVRGRLPDVLVPPRHHRLPDPSATAPTPPATLHQGRIILQQAQGFAEIGGHLVVVGFRIPIGAPDSAFIWLTPGSGPTVSLAGNDHIFVQPQAGNLAFDEIPPFTAYGAVVAHVIPRRRGLFGRVDSDNEFERQAQFLVNRVGARLKESFVNTRPVRHGATKDELLNGVADAVERTHDGLRMAVRGWHPENTTATGVAFWIHAPGLSEVEIRGAMRQPNREPFLGGLTSPGPFILPVLGSAGFRDDGIHGVLQ